MKSIRQQIKQEWQDLWDYRLEDKVVAEDVATRNYELLFVEKGTVIKATRDYKPLDLRDIMTKNERLLGITVKDLDPEVGGWRKFSKDVLSKQPRRRKSIRNPPRPHKEQAKSGPSKKGGRGWLHTNQ